MPRWRISRTTPDMRLLADTHVLLWAIDAPDRLSGAAREALLDEDNTVSVSVVSLWEIAIKISIGRLELAPDWPAAIEDGRKILRARWLALDTTHCEQVASLPWHHRDPFDRMLAVQAMSEGLTLISKDHILAEYPAPVLW